MSANGYRQLADSSALSKTATYATGAAVGDVVVVGNKEYTYIYNAGNSSITTGDGCVVAAAATSPASCTVSSAAGDLIAGAAVTTITTGMYGWVQSKGSVTLTSATVGVSKPFTVGANGAWVISSGATGTVVGMATVVASGSTALQGVLM